MKIKTNKSKGMGGAAFLYPAKSTNSPLRQITKIVKVLADPRGGGGGAKDAPLHSRSNFFHFQEVFSKNLAK